MADSYCRCTGTKQANALLRKASNMVVMRISEEDAALTALGYTF